MKIFYSPSTGGFYTGDLSEYEEAGSLPVDLFEISEQKWRELLAAQEAGQVIKAGPNGSPVASDPPPPSDEELIVILTAAVQAHLDAEAKKLGYDDIRSAVTYADEPAVLKFQAEGQAFREWRSLAWKACHDRLAAVQTGQAPVPTKEELIESLPELQLPG